MSKIGLIVIDTGYACGGVETTGGVVTRAPPIFRWMVGKPVEHILGWKKIKSFYVYPEKEEGEEEIEFDEGA